MGTKKKKKKSVSGSKIKARSSPGKGEGKLSRSEIITVRFDPKLKFAAELAAAKHRRSLSSFVEWAVAQAVKEEVLIATEGDVQLTIHDATERIWDVDEADRFVKLASNYPHLLSHEEDVLWKIIRENDILWLPKYYIDESDSKGNQIDWIQGAKKNSRHLLFDALRAIWDDFKKVARGEKDIKAVRSPKLEGTNSHYFY